jgi:hypothetical protein
MSRPLASTHRLRCSFSGEACFFYWFFGFRVCGLGFGFFGGLGFRVWGFGFRVALLVSCPPPPSYSSHALPSLMHAKSARL